MPMRSRNSATATKATTVADRSPQTFRLYSRSGAGAVIRRLGARQRETLMRFAEPMRIVPRRTAARKSPDGDGRVARSPWPTIDSLCARGLMWAEMRDTYRWIFPDRDGHGRWKRHPAGYEYWAGLTPLGEEIRKALGFEEAACA